ncbi:MAG: anthranilate phosphoribosyltransferase [Flavisolibacter sp.]|nr:anthranilate phosphoribosyltransferase [Flavisolibacter sp.]
MKKILEKLFEHKTLTAEDCRQIMLNISNGNYNQVEIASFITVYLMRSITIEELEGFRDGLLELALDADLETYNVLDVVGTGGDGKNTFNISTLACFILAGAGQKMAKHGNYGASSGIGASNVMETLGYKFKTTPDALRKELDTASITYLHAPLFHPALKTVAGIRKELGFRTFFNMLGPLVNPAKPAFQLIGVYNPEMARIYSYILQKTGKPFTIIHGLDGYDEISLTADTKVINKNGERIYGAPELGKRTVSPADISGGNTVNTAAKIFIQILKGEGTWAQNAVVFANAAMALHGAGIYSDYNEAYYAAVESLESGNAYTSFKKLMELQ